MRLVPLACFVTMIGGACSSVGENEPLELVREERGGIESYQALARMKAAYRNCKQYSDRGYVVITRTLLPYVIQSRSRFETSFIRPDRLQLRWTNEFAESADWDTYDITWKNQQATRRFSFQSPFFGERLLSSFGRAEEIGQILGEILIPLLLPEQSREWEPSMQGQFVIVEQKPDQRIAGRDCFHFHWVTAHQDADYWIDRQKHLVRRILIVKEEGALRWEIEIHFTPSIEDEVPEWLFDYREQDEPDGWREQSIDSAQSKGPVHSAGAWTYFLGGRQFRPVWRPSRTLVARRSRQKGARCRPGVKLRT